MLNAVARSRIGDLVDLEAVLAVDIIRNKHPGIWALVHRAASVEALAIGVALAIEVVSEAVSEVGSVVDSVVALTLLLVLVAVAAEDTHLAEVIVEDIVAVGLGTMDPAAAIDHMVNHTLHLLDPRHSRTDMIEEDETMQTAIGDETVGVTADETADVIVLHASRITLTMTTETEIANGPTTAAMTSLAYDAGTDHTRHNPLVQYAHFQW